MVSAHSARPCPSFLCCLPISLRRRHCVVCRRSLGLTLSASPSPRAGRLLGRPGRPVPLKPTRSSASGSSVAPSTPRWASELLVGRARPAALGPVPPLLRGSPSLPGLASPSLACGVTCLVTTPHTTQLLCNPPAPGASGSLARKGEGITASGFLCRRGGRGQGLPMATVKVQASRDCGHVQGVGQTALLCGGAQGSRPGLGAVSWC